MLNKKLFLLIVTALFLSFSVSCERFEGDQEIPAYLQIDTIALQYTSTYPGITPTSKIVDAWVYLNGSSIGDYQLPLKIPVLKRGECKLTIYPGILANEQSMSRRGYAFYTSYETTVFFAEDSVTHIKEIKTNIKPSAHFNMNETFDDVNIAFDTISTYGRTAGVERVAVDKLGLESRLYGSYVGSMTLTKDNPGCMILSKEKFNGDDMPFNRDLMVEVDYCCNNEFAFGLQYVYQGRNERYDMLILGAQKKMEWTKGYINIAPRITELLHSGAKDFQIYFATDLPSEAESAQLYFDNIRIVRNKTE